MSGTKGGAKAPLSTDVTKIVSAGPVTVLKPASFVSHGKLHVYVAGQVVHRSAEIKALQEHNVPFEV